MANAQPPLPEPATQPLTRKEHLELMVQRAAQGQSLFHPQDAQCEE